MSYQLDYYRQQDLVYELKDNRELLKEKNIMYLTTSEPKIGVTRFYSLNSIERKAFEDQTHFVVNGINDLKYLIGTSPYTMETFVYDEDYQMAEFDKIYEDLGT